MRLSTRLHGLLDYVVGALLLALPWIIRVSPGEPAGAVPLVVGAIVILNAIATNFELGAIRRLQIAVHLWIDAIAGVLLAAAPWVLSFDQRGWIPHLALGLVLIVAAFLTNTVPGFDRRRSSSAAG